MTLIELLTLLLMLGIGVGAAHALFPVGGLPLAIPGFIAGVALIPLTAFAYDRYRKWAYLGDKWMPDCSCGSADFKYERVGAEHHLLCQRCRTRYEVRRGSAFVFDGSVKKPYKRLVKHQGWID
jgi:hypothetical protein